MILNLKSLSHSPTETLCYSRRYERCESPRVSLAMCAYNSEHARVILTQLVQSIGHKEGGLVDGSKNIRGASLHYLENSGLTQSPPAPKMCSVPQQHGHHRGPVRNAASQAVRSPAGSGGFPCSLQLEGGRSSSHPSLALVLTFECVWESPGQLSKILLPGPHFQRFSHWCGAQVEY